VNCNIWNSNYFPPLRNLSNLSLVTSKGNSSFSNYPSFSFLHAQSPPLHTDPPLIYSSPTTITVNETGEFLLSCEYDSNPITLLSVRWLQDNTVLNLNQSRFDGGTPELQNLVVKNATREDSGTYVCELSNQVGTGKSEQAIYVDVQCEYSVHTLIEFIL
jgi:hypothetical protein